MITFAQAVSKEDLEAIIALQSVNLQHNLSDEQRKSQGFLTISHSFDLLNRMNNNSSNILAKANDLIVGFCLSMTQAFEQDIPILIPMFKTMNSVVFQDKILKEYKYITVGQVCVGEGFRGQGVFEGLYKAFREQFENDYEMAMTEIALRNTRSLAAHKRVGFVPLEQYTAPDGEVWQMVVWDWRN